LDHVWESYQFNFWIVCGNLNLPNICWTNGVSCLNYNGSVTDKVRQIGNQYGTLHFEQINIVFNKFNSILDLVISNSKSIKVEESTDAKKKQAHKIFKILSDFINLNQKNCIDPMYVECKSSCRVILAHFGTMPKKAKVVKEFLKRFILEINMPLMIKYQIYLPRFFSSL